MDSISALISAWKKCTNWHQKSFNNIAYMLFIFIMIVVPSKRNSHPRETGEKLKLQGIYYWRWYVNHLGQITVYIQIKLVSYIFGHIGHRDGGACRNFVNLSIKI